MARIIILDSGPLGLACRNPKHGDVVMMRSWLDQAEAGGVLLVVPEIADYELRRGLIQSRSFDGVNRLDALCRELIYLPIKTSAMKRAAQIWADQRSLGLPTASNSRLDGDVILAAQALEFAGLGDILIVATDNSRHLSPMRLDARPWDEINP